MVKFVKNPPHSDTMKYHGVVAGGTVQPVILRHGGRARLQQADAQKVPPVMECEAASVEHTGRSAGVCPGKKAYEALLADSTLYICNRRLQKYTIKTDRWERLAIGLYGVPATVPRVEGRGRSFGKVPPSQRADGVALGWLKAQWYVVGNL